MIREYQSADLESLLNTWYQASLVAHPFLEDAFLQKEKQMIQDVYIPNTKTWVYEDEGIVVGFIAMMDNEVGAIFVMPNKQGRGIGSQLMNWAAQMHSTLEVEVFEKNKIGRGFYKRYGFRFLSKNMHEETGNTLLRLKYSVD
ncbi:MAG: N-acetyltransferase [Bacteroidota bacterium]